jgi:hypothetical protein
MKLAVNMIFLMSFLNILCSIMRANCDPIEIELIRLAYMRNSEVKIGPSEDWLSVMSWTCLNIAHWQLGDIVLHPLTLFLILE